MSVKRDRLKILAAIAHTEPLSYSTKILEHINRDVPDNWLTRWWLTQGFYRMTRNTFFGRVIDMEDEGLIRTEPGPEVALEASYGRRKYYRLTDKGRNTLLSTRARHSMRWWIRARRHA